MGKCFNQITHREGKFILMLCVKTLIYRDAVDYVILVGLGCHRWTTRISRKKLIYLQEKNGFCSVGREKRERKKIINQLNELWVVDLWLKKKHVHFKHIFLRLQTAVNTSEWWCRTFSVNHANKHSNGNFPFCYQLQVEMRTI